MPYDHPAPTDPTTLIGVSVPGDPEAVRTMAEAFADEFAQLGHPGDAIMALFRNPHYRGAHDAYGVLGESAIRSIVDESLRVWSRLRIVVRDDAESGAQDRPLVRDGGFLKMVKP